MWWVGVHFTPDDGAGLLAMCAQKKAPQNGALFKTSARLGLHRSLFDFLFCGISLIHLLKPFIHDDHERARNVDRVDRRNADTDRHDDGEIARRSRPDECQRYDGKKRRCARHGRSRQAVVDRLVDDRLERRLWIRKPDILADAVEVDDRIVDAVADEREECRDRFERNFEPEHDDKAPSDERTRSERNDGCGGITRVEADGDVEKHEPQSHENAHDGIATEFIADFGTNRDDFVDTRCLVESLAKRIVEQFHDVVLNALRLDGIAIETGFVDDFGFESCAHE